MSRARALQLILILASVALTTFLYLSPKTNLNVAPLNQTTIDFEHILQQAKSRLQRQEVTSLNEMEKILEIKSGGEKVSVLDSLAWRWDVIGEPAVAAGYYEHIASISPSEKTWNDAADRYFASLQSHPDSLEHLWLLNHAIDSYKKVTDINPENIDAKMNLAICYTETSSPMQGIMLLRDVVAKYPDNAKAQFNLGLLSIRSQQYDKAIERFKKVLELNSAQPEANYFLGFAYMNKQDNVSALRYFNRYIETGKDVQLRDEANVYIRQLEKSN
ncbi:MAG: tetratricopeptide repeat protein [Bacteroidia bacterium]|nr:tetratricopeptide repeat protein [Bacteroidia bacterium]